MAGHDVIVLGASAGGVEVLVRLVRQLPPGLPAALLVVCHVPADGVSVLPDILSRAGPLLATHARDGEPLHPGHVYVAPPDHHLLVQPGRVVLSRDARENNFRPAIDPLFRSAARAYGPRVVGVVLSGALYDGVAGLLAVRSEGGVTVVQSPEDALVAALPRRAAEVVHPDHVVPTAGLAPLLLRLIHQPVPAEEGQPMPDPLDMMPTVVDQAMAAQERGDRRGDVSVFTCPECGGALWQVDEQQLVRFRCHVGHAYHGEVLLTEQAEVLEAALWTAVRIFRERSVLNRQLAAAQRQRGHEEAARRFEEQAGQADRYGELIRQHVLLAGPPPAEAAP